MSARQRSVAVETRVSASGAKSYRLRWYYAGKTQTTTVYSRAEARSAVLAIEALGCDLAAKDPRVESGSLWNPEARESAHGGMTYGEAADVVISENDFASPRSLAKYRLEVASDNPLRSGRFRDQSLATITADDVRAWVRALRDAGNAQSSIDTRTSFCRQVFRAALRKGWLRSNPWEQVRRGTDPMQLTRDRAVHHVLTQTEVARLVACADQPRFADMWHVLSRTGLRIGELLALTVGNVRLDGDAGTIHVRQGLSHRGKEVIETKTARSRRAVALDPDTVRRLRPRVDGRAPSEFVFATVKGEPVGYNTVLHAWYRSREAAGIDPTTRLHDLRHTHASWLLNDGVPVVAVSERLGHASVKITTDVYGHVDPHGREAIMRSLAGRAETAGKVTPIAGRKRERSA